MRPTQPVRPLLRTLLPALLLAALPGAASETDSFTVRRGPVPDVAQALNARTNALLDEAVEQANVPPELPLGLGRLMADGGCNVARLYAAINDRMGGPLVGTLEKYANTSPELPRRRLSRRDSVYQAFRIFEAPSLGGEVGRLAAVVNLDGHLIGADKLGHFFSQGYAYFEKAYLQGEGVEAAMAYGEWSERTYYGALLTGVYSYADLVANFNGMRFWIHLLDEFPDPLGEEAAMPYVSCFQGRWVRNREFDWRAYVDAGWDEAFNCNGFRNPQLVSKVGRAIASLERRFGERLDCPVSRQPGPMLRAKYGPYYGRLVNLDGHRVMSPVPWLEELASRLDLDS